MLNIVNRKKEKEKIFKEKENLPKIYISNEELENAFYRWLGIDKKRKSRNNDNLDELEIRLGKMLKQQGISKDELCIFEDYDETTQSFKCVMFTEEKELSLKIENQVSTQSSVKEIYVTHENKVERYFHRTEDNNEKRDIFHLLSYTKKNQTTGRTLERDIDKIHYILTIIDDNNIINITIEYPKTLFNDNMDKLYINIDQLEDILLNIQLPQNIEDLYKIIIDNIKLSIDIYPEIGLITAKGNDRCRMKPKDSIYIKYGKPSQIRLENNGKTYIYENSDNWCYEDEKYSVIHKKGNTTIYDKTNNIIEMSQEYIEETYRKVEEVQKLTFKKIENAQN